MIKGAFMLHYNKSYVKLEHKSNDPVKASALTTLSLKKLIISGRH
jgi:hypothetical protein